jgi:hypothetical protein
VGLILDFRRFSATVNNEPACEAMCRLCSIVFEDTPQLFLLVLIHKRAADLLGHSFTFSILCSAAKIVATAVRHSKDDNFATASIVAGCAAFTLFVIALLPELSLFPDMCCTPGTFGKGCRPLGCWEYDEDAWCMRLTAEAARRIQVDENKSEPRLDGCHERGGVTRCGSDEDGSDNNTGWCFVPDSEAGEMEPCKFHDERDGWCAVADSAAGEMEICRLPGARDTCPEGTKCTARSDYTPPYQRCAGESSAIFPTWGTSGTSEAWTPEPLGARCVPEGYTMAATCYGRRKRTFAPRKYGYPQSGSAPSSHHGGSYAGSVLMSLVWLCVACALAKQAT